MAEVKWKYQYGIFAILVAALVIRLWGINHQIYTDENKVIAPSVKLAQGKQETLLYPKGSYYPHLYHYVLGIAFLPAALMDSPYPAAGTQLDTYTLIARVVTALFAVATVFIAYLLGAQILNKRLGIIAALFLAFLPLHLKYSHYAHVDIPLTFTTALALFASVRLWKTEQLRWYVIAGMLTGISGAIHYTGFVIGIALLLAYALSATKKHVYLFIALALIPVSFVASTPYTVIKWRESLAAYQQLQLRGAAGDLGYTRPDYLWPLTTSSPDWGLPFTLSGVFWEFNPFMVILAVLGLGWIFYARNWKLGLFLGGTLIIMYLAIIGRLPLYAIKRLLPLAPILALLAAWTVHEFKYAIGILLVTGITLQNAFTGIGFNIAYSKGSTHSKAVAWAEQNIPYGSTVLQHTPIKLIDWNNTNYTTIRLNEVYASFNAKDPEVSHDRAKPLSYWITEQGAQYIAMDSRIVDRYFDPTSVKLFPETAASYQAFYSNIRNKGKLVYKIEPKLWNIAGPRVEIYDIRGIQ